MKRTPERQCRLAVTVVRAALPIVCLACAQAPAAAQQVELTPFVGWRAFGELTDWSGAHVEANDAMSFGGLLSVNARPEMAVEFGFSRQDTHVRLSQPFLGIDRYDVNIDQWTLGARQLLPRPGNALLFGSGFLGLSRMASSQGDESVTKFMLGGGVGTRLMNPSRRLGARLEARGYLTFAGGGSASIGCGTGGGCGFGYAGQVFFQMDFMAGVTVGLGAS